MATRSFAYEKLGICATTLSCGDCVLWRVKHKNSRWIWQSENVNPRTKNGTDIVALRETRKVAESQDTYRYVQASRYFSGKCKPKNFS